MTTSANMKRLFVDAVEEIIDPETGRVAGIVYEWNTGERRKQWIGTRLEVFDLRPIEDGNLYSIA